MSDSIFCDAGSGTPWRYGTLAPRPNVDGGKLRKLPRSPESGQANRISDKAGQLSRPRESLWIRNDTDEIESIMMNLKGF